MFHSVTFWVESAWLAVCLYWLATWSRVKPTIRSEGTGSRTLQIFLVCCFAVLMFGRSRMPAFLETQLVPRSTMAAAIGIAVCMAGALLAIVARSQLGGNWSAAVTIKQGHELIHTGPYALVRHPIYFGLLVAAAGTAIAYGQVRDWVALLVLTVAFRLKQLKEEQLLIESFGQQYRDYQQRVRSALIPFLL